jgi:hypothetical protein
MADSSESYYANYLNCPVVMVGAGGIGSNLLPLIVKCGPEKLTILDDDVVKPVNLAQQQFAVSDVGEAKAIVLARQAAAINPEICVTAMRVRVDAGCYLDGIVISGVDSMKSRRVIFDEVNRQKDRVRLFIDGRLSRKSNEWVELYFIDPKLDDEVEYYREWLFTDEEAGPPGPRPTKLSAHTPIMLAGLLGTGLARWVHEGCHPLKVTFDGSTFTLDMYWPDTTLRRK